MKDLAGRAIILRRIKRFASGNPGDIRSVGDGVSEMRINYGPGYRIYFILRQSELILLLCGGDKGSQSSDIARAKKMLLEVEDNGFADDAI